MRRARAVFRPNVKSAAAAPRGKTPSTTKEPPAKVTEKEPKGHDKQEKTTVQAAEEKAKKQPETSANTSQNVSTPPLQKTDSNSSVKVSLKPAQPNKALSKQTEKTAGDKVAGKNTDSVTADNTLSSSNDKNKKTSDAEAGKIQKEVKASNNGGQKSASVAGRRKRVTAVPNLGRPRQGSSTSGKPAEPECEQQKLNKMAARLPCGKPPPRHIPPLVIPRRRLDSTSSVDGRDGSERPLTIPHRERRVSGMYTPNIQPERRREKEQEEEEGPAKRRQRHNQSKPPDKNRMTMADLIYYNPKTNMMKSTEEKAKKLKEKKKQKQDVDAMSERGQEEEMEEELLEEAGSQDKPPAEEEAEGDDSLLVPQVRVAEDGTIVLNEQSLTVSTPAKKAGSDNDIVREDESNTTYSSFRKKVPQTQAWNMKETIKFYKALSTVGTDFTLMAAMLPKRTRAQLKAKFKKEEKQNRNLVDRALSLRQEFDMSTFNQSESDSEDEKQKKRKDHAPRRGKGRPRGAENNEQGGKRKAGSEHDREPVSTRLSSPLAVSPKNAAGFPSYARPDMGRDGDADGSRREHTEDADDENEEEETRIVEMLKGPTRAGRQPKRVQTFSINIEPTRKRPRPPTVVNRASPIASPPRFSPGQGSTGSAGRKRWLYIPGETGPRSEGRGQAQGSGNEQENDPPVEEMVETVMIQSPVRFEPSQPIPQLIQGTALNGSVVLGDVEELVFTDDEGSQPTVTTTTAAATAQYTLVIPVVSTNINTSSPSRQQTVSVIVPTSSAAHNASLDGINTSGGSERLSLSFVTGEHLTASDILEQMQMEGRKEQGEEEEEEEEVPVVIGEEMITEIVTEIQKEQPEADSSIDKGAAGLEAES
ncbi:Transcription factor TFIIIB component B [Branchiostoma belcheri]|nr:Transcription factor TFIIIB component B [Branchiostoma belcheri]